jgi:hypothetical protein
MGASRGPFRLAGFLVGFWVGVFGWFLGWGFWVGVFGLGFLGGYLPFLGGYLPFLGGYLPLKTGSRFSTNALMPSAASSDFSIAR